MEIGVSSRVSCACKIDASIVGRTQAQGGSRVFFVAPLLKFSEFMLLCGLNGGCNAKFSMN